MSISSLLASLQGDLASAAQGGMVHVRTGWDGDRTGTVADADGLIVTG
jgi:hypothetical protein